MDQSIIASSSLGNQDNTGDAGEILIEARQVTLTNGAKINSSTLGSGQGGTIHLRVADALIASGQHANGTATSIAATSESEELAKAGKAGNIEVEARQVILADGAQISSSTKGMGQGGSIQLQVSDTLAASGQDVKSNPSGVYANSNSKDAEHRKAGDAGQIEIAARQIILTDGAHINSLTKGRGQGGTIRLQVVDTLTISGQDRKGDSSGIHATSENADTGKAGEAGNIEIKANRIVLSKGEKLDSSKLGDHISTETNNAGGGDIILLTSNLLYLKTGQITTSVKGGTGNGGNITIQAPVFVILATAKIVGQAEEGRGGNIMIQASQFVATPNSLVSASSKKGISGNVVVTSPENNLSGKLLVLSVNPLNAAAKLKSSCGAKNLEELVHRSRFYVFRLEGSSLLPEDWQPSSLPSQQTSPLGSITPVRARHSVDKQAHHREPSAARQVLVMMTCQKVAKRMAK